MGSYKAAEHLIQNIASSHLINFENALADSGKHLFIDNSIRDDLVSDYLLVCSIPFVFTEDIDFELSDVWPIKCSECDSVVNRKFYPTGNLRPKIIVVGDAPSAYGGCFSERGLGRAWLDKRTCVLLRMALDKLNLHRFAWYTNLLKCSVPENRPSSKNEIKMCKRNLDNEMKFLKPKLAILLGKHVSDNWDYDIKSVSVYHPSYAVRVGMKVDGYAKHIKSKLKGVLKK